MADIQSNRLTSFYDSKQLFHHQRSSDSIQWENVFKLIFCFALLFSVFTAYENLGYIWQFLLKEKKKETLDLKEEVRKNGCLNHTLLFTVIHSISFCHLSHQLSSKCTHGLSKPCLKEKGKN